MSQNATSYIFEISEQYKTGRAGEHAYRPALAKLIKSLDPKLGVVNDPKRTEYGAPDFIFVKGELIAGYAETKDINIDLDKTIKTEQLERYLGYSNLILTNYLEFRFFRNGQPYGDPIILGKIEGNTVKIIDESASTLENAIKDFLTAQPEAIKSGIRLAKIMGGKARRIRDNVKQFLTKESEENKELVKVYETIRQLLVHDLDYTSFADMYAQTLVYGLFVARYHDDSPASFTRQEARDLVPASNPFLRHFFDHIAGANFDQRLAYIVNELCDIFQVADVQQLMNQYFEKDLFGGEIKGPDPVIHFYEDFLKEYDPALRKKMGAYYTPLPVVRFIVKAVDDILQKEFKLPEGLSDTSKLANGLHRVQVLDPAVGTGTFISAVIRKIYERFVRSKQEGRWPTYVHHDLLPRIYGFELMMASYTIAHLKLSIAFKETGFKHFNRRLGIYLTNSLEQAGIQPELLGIGLAESIANESKEAYVIKNKKPIMVVIGNPPYSGESSNKFYAGHDIYKTEPTGGKLKERNSKWLNDDYVKFIRLAEEMIEKNNEGIVAMITAHGYIDNPTFRGMRHHLMETFNSIYVLDLHGNVKKEEKTSEGDNDENIFDIQQGVSIFLGIKHEEKSEGKLANIYKADLFGTRKSKFNFLDKNSVASIQWDHIEPLMPKYEWTKRDTTREVKYLDGFSVNELFLLSSVGIASFRDGIAIDFDKNNLANRLRDFMNLSSEELIQKYNIPKDTTSWKLDEARNSVVNKYEDQNIIKIAYRPFDERWIYYDHEGGFLARPRFNVMKHLLHKENIAILFPRQLAVKDFSHVFVARGLIDMCLLTNRTKEAGYVFPLYTYLEDGEKISNFNKDIIREIKRTVGEIESENVLDYVYGILNSPSYREEYKEFLKTDFPRVPYPKNKETFKKFVSLGRELRLLHLFESSKLSDFITSYPEDGSDVVEKITYKDGKVSINDKQYFGDVPEIAWSFYVGGYQPAQKWLKDRKGRTLNNEDIEHYQKIIVALTETDRIMKEIDKIFKP